MHQTGILCVLPALPDPSSGGGVLIYDTLCHLQTRGVVHVVVPVADHLQAKYGELTREPDLAGIRWHPLAEAPSRSRWGRIARRFRSTPVEVLRFATPASQAVLARARAASNPAVELVISSRAVSPYPALALPGHARLYMLDIDPAIERYDGPSLKRRLASMVEYWKVDRIARGALRRAGRVGAISASMIDELNRMAGRTDVEHVPPLMPPRPADRRNVEPFHVLITTNFTYQPNVGSLNWFLAECWPLVDTRARLTVTGRDAGDELARLCKGARGVTYAGCLPRRELDQLFGRVALAVNPTLTGSGFQIKLLDAIARGVPVVSTAFSNRIGAAIASSDDPRELADLINARLVPGAVPPFDYETFHTAAIAAWDWFLGLENR